MAQLAILQPRLWQAVQSGAISLAEAWAFQDWMELAPQYPQSESREAPDCLQPMLGRLWLLETPVPHQLPM